MEETQAIAERYARRSGGDRYSMLRPEVWQGVQERQRCILRLFGQKLSFDKLSEVTLVEVGCGTGSNLMEFLRVGFAPENLSGIELLPERVAVARRFLPVSVSLLEGDASKVEMPPSSKDIVFQAVVFSSLLEYHFQEELAGQMWRWVKPGGGILWYDFIFNNPSNPDVRGVPIKRIRELFPGGEMIIRRLTLAPPISRIVCRIHPHAYHLFNAIPWLRTHVLCWIAKPFVA